MKLKYSDMISLLEMMDDDALAGCLKLYNENKSLFDHAKGSHMKHQAWEGGYIHHVEEIMNYARLFYLADKSTGREMPFRLSDALVVLYLHDLEKPWKQSNSAEHAELAKYDNYHDFIFAKAKEYNIPLSDEQINALRYIHGEGDDYHPEKCIQGGLAAFAHICDTYSARTRCQYPLENDPWKA